MPEIHEVKIPTHFVRKNYNPPKPEKVKRIVNITGAVAGLIAAFVAWYVMLVPVNLRAEEFWISIVLITAVVVFSRIIMSSILTYGYEQESAGKKGNWAAYNASCTKKIAIPVALLVVFFVVYLSGAQIFNAKRYSEILKVETVEFSEDMGESVGTDSIALMDTNSARMLGDREIGTLSNLVSQFNVSYDYSQIDFGGRPVKVSALDYAGFFKWINNKNEGVPGYVSVDPVSMSASYKESAGGMKYVPSAYFSQDAARHIRFQYPTVMFGNLHFEIDEEGKPYYVASVYDKKISVFGGQTVKGAIIMDPVTGETEMLSVADVPNWVDIVFDGNLICEQYNWYGKLNGGYWNSVIAKKGCRRVTEYYSSDEEDDAPQSDYGYVAKDGDIWIYTGVTSVNGDSSNIGFLMADERTGVAHYYGIAGADEKSAMSAAEGEVQEKGYQASFPSLINIDGNPTYIMVLKDASGLVKLYAAVNVEQYNLVTTAQSQSECLSKYRSMLGIETKNDDEITDTEEITVAVKDIKYIDIEGNTYIYIITENDELYRAKAYEHEEMLLVNIGDELKLTVSGKNIISCE